MLRCVGTGRGNLLEQIANYWGYNIYFYIGILLGKYIFRMIKYAHWNLMCMIHFMNMHLFSTLKVNK